MMARNKVCACVTPGIIGLQEKRPWERWKHQKVSILDSAWLANQLAPFAGNRCTRITLALMHASSSATAALEVELVSDTLK